MTDEFSIKDFLAAEGVKRWRVISNGAFAFYPTASLAESAGLVEAIARIDGIQDHAPNVDHPHNRDAAFWFEQMEEPRGDGGGAIHLAIWLPIEEAQKRIDAALASSGRMVRDEFTPSWWTLADAAGNEADIATAGGRD
jgi:hypothetical protein